MGLLMGIFTRNSYFFADDFLYLQMAEHDRLSIGHLRRALFGHFAPVTRLLYWILEHAAPLNFRLAHLFATGVFLACVGCLAALVRRLAGTGPMAFVAVAWWALSIFSLRVLDWWGASVHIFLSFLFTLLCLLLFVRWMQEGRRSDRWLSVVAFAAALLVQERPLLVPLYLVLLRYGVLNSEPLALRGILHSIRRDLGIWLPYAALAALDLLNLLVFYATGAGRPALGVTLHFLRLSLTDGYLPGLVGSFFFQSGSNAGWHPPYPLGQWLGGALAIALITHSLVRYPAWRAWFMAAAVYVANMVLLVSGRQSTFKPIEKATDLQYYVEVHLFFCLAVAIAYSGRPRRRRLPQLRLLARTAGLAALVLATAGFALGARDLIRISWPPRTAHVYVQNIRVGLTALDRSGRGRALLPLYAPPDVAVPFIVPYDDHISFLRIVPEFHGFGADSQEKYVVDRSGRVRPVVPFVHESAYNSIPYEISGPVRERPVDAGGQRCFVPEFGATVSVPLRGLSSAEALFVALDYSSDRPQEIQLGQDTGEGKLGYTAWPQILPSGRHITYVRLEKSTARRIYILNLAAGSRFCMRGLDVVSLLFADRPDGGGRCPEVGRLGEELAARPCGGHFRRPVDATPPP